MNDARDKPEISTLNVARITLGVSLGMTLLRLAVARGTGFGDAEALYASYALHPQPAYLDHPGLVGSLMALLGGGAPPDAQTAHLVSSVAATAVAWLGGLSARALGASWRGALLATLALSLIPETSIGLYAVTPDLCLAPLWFGALLCFAAFLRAEAGSYRSLLSALGVGVMVGAACISKLSGVLLGAALIAALCQKPLRSRWRNLAPWAAIGVALILVSPVVSWEVARGFPMFRHRLLDSQAGAGFSLRNLGALLGGQLLYLTPPVAYAAWLLARDLYRRRKSDIESGTLWLCLVVPGIPLAILCLWSRVAEPHWLAPALLALAVHYGRRPELVSRRWARASVALGVGVAALAWAYVKTPLPMKTLGSLYKPRYDLANDLYAWAPGKRLLHEAVDRSMLETRRLPVVVGPHYIVCAQAAVALAGRVPVGCNTPIRDDFDDWLPRERWLSAPVVLYVYDSRFSIDPERELPDRKLTSLGKVDVYRGGMSVRTIHVARLEKTSDVALAQRPPAHAIK